MRRVSVTAPPRARKPLSARSRRACSPSARRTQASSGPDEIVSLFLAPATVGCSPVCRGRAKLNPRNCRGPVTVSNGDRLWPGSGGWWGSALPPAAKPRGVFADPLLRGHPATPRESLVRAVFVVEYCVLAAKGERG